METKMYWMNSEGKMAESVKAPELDRGTIIWVVGFGCQTEKYAITERLSNGSYKAVILDASALSRDGWFCEPFTQVEEYCRPISEQFGIGAYYDLDEPKATEEEIKTAIEAGNAYKERVKAEEAREAKEAQEARDTMRAKYAGKYPEITSRYGNEVQVGKNIRKDLAEAFPGCKFSVKKRHYESIIISWTDGPTEDEVKGIASKWEQSCKRDQWNDDIWDYSDTIFTSVFGGVESIWYDRDFSQEQQEKMTAEISALCPGLPVNNAVYASDEYYQLTIKARNTYPEIDHNLTWVSCRILAEWVLKGRNLYVKADAQRETKITEVKGIKIINYSAKAIAVIGETRAISDQLKALGGRFNSHLHCGAGWIFSKAREETLRKALAL